MGGAEGKERAGNRLFWFFAAKNTGDLASRLGRQRVKRAFKIFYSVGIVVKSLKSIVIFRLWTRLWPRAVKVLF
jgi:hypothetical protein